MANSIGNIARELTLGRPFHGPAGKPAVRKIRSYTTVDLTLANRRAKKKRYIMQKMSPAFRPKRMKKERRNSNAASGGGGRRRID